MDVFIQIHHRPLIEDGQFAGVAQKNPGPNPGPGGAPEASRELWIPHLFPNRRVATRLANPRQVLARAHSQTTVHASLHTPSRPSAPPTTPFYRVSVSISLLVLSLNQLFVPVKEPLWL